MTWLRETPYSLCYYLFVETRSVPQGNDLGYSKNAKDWAIRRRVPKAVKDEARACLRHYPSEYDMKKVSQTSADIFAERMEDVERMFKKYEEGKNEQA